jgi:hypothetical protein
MDDDADVVLVPAEFLFRKATRSLYRAGSRRISSTSRDDKKRERMIMILGLVLVNMAVWMCGVYLFSLIFRGDK